MKDHVADKSGKELYRMNAETPLPGFVKEASVISSEDVPGMTPSQFADTSTKTFPICSKADTYLSAAFFQKNAYQNPLVEARLRDACALWDVDYDKVSEKHIEKVASTVEGTVSYKCSAGTVVSEVAYANAEQLQKIATDLIENPLNYTYAMRNSAAKDCLEKIAYAELPNHLVSSLQKCAGIGVGSESRALEAITARRLALPKKGFDTAREKIAGLAKVVKAEAIDGLLSGAFVEKLAGLLDRIDHVNDYGKYSMTAPEQAIMGLSLNDFDGYTKGHLKLANGRSFHSSRLNYRDMADFLSVAFGKEATGEEAVNNELTSLTGTDADVVCRYLDKQAEEEEKAPKLTDEQLKDGNKDELPNAELGLDWPSDESEPREEENKDETPRKG